MQTKNNCSFGQYILFFYSHRHNPVLPVLLDSKCMGLPEAGSDLGGILEAERTECPHLVGDLCFISIFIT